MSLPIDPTKVSSSQPVEHPHEQTSDAASSQRDKMLPGSQVQSTVKPFSASQLSARTGNEELRTLTLEEVVELHNQLKSYKFRSEKRGFICKI